MTIKIQKPNDESYEKFFFKRRYHTANDLVINLIQKMRKIGDNLIFYDETDNYIVMKFEKMI